MGGRPGQRAADRGIAGPALLPAQRSSVPLQLDAEQERVVAHRGSNLLVLAGPGTGKTATLAELIADRVLGRSGPAVPAERVLALTFGRRAARELAERVAQRTGGGPQPVVATFHAYAFALVRQHADAEAFLHPPRLLTAAEQDARVQELLTHSVREGRLRWPKELAGAVGTRGIAEQVRQLMARARSQQLDGPALAARGRAAGIPAWVAVGRFMAEYEDTLGFDGSMDYTDLLVDATALVSGTDRRARTIRAGLELIVVDEYQDTDPAQVLFLRRLAQGGAAVVAVGDPDQAIYAFRGADPQGLLEFPEHFADPVTAAPAPIIVLRTARRFPRPIAAAAHGVLSRVTLGTLPASVQRQHRAPLLRDDPADVAVRTYPSAEAQASAIADHLLRAHAGVDLPRPLLWSQMAVLMRNPAQSGAPVARALRRAGIPVSLAADELPLAEEPAVSVLSTVLRLVIDGPDADPGGGRVLLGGPLGGADPVVCRALARAALREARAAAHGAASDPAAGTEGVPEGAHAAGVQGPMTVAEGDVRDAAPEALDAPAPSGVAAAPADLGSAPANVAGVPAGLGAAAPERLPDSELALTTALLNGAAPRGVPRAAPFDRVATTLAAARAAAAGGTVSDVLWAAWTATDWPSRLQRTALASGRGAVSANRDLDAVVALFDLAARLPSQLRGPAAIRGFLDGVAAQRIAPGVRSDWVRDEVRLISAHRAKGLEWELVVVAGVQEGVWPDVRLRSDLLRVRELSSRGVPSTADLLGEERRLLYVACTRARSSLLVTAVAEPVDGGAAPSRFLADLGVPVEAHGAVRRTPVRVDGLVAELRRAAAAPVTPLADGSPDPDVEALRHAALVRLAALATRARGGGGGGDRAGRPGPGGAEGEASAVLGDDLLVGPLRVAHPASWWGVRPLSGAASAVEPAGGSRLLALDEVGSSGGVPAEGLPAVGPAAGGSSAPTPVDAPMATLSPSTVEQILACPLRWFLERRAEAGARSGPAAAIGSVVHELARAVVAGELPASLSAIEPVLDELWEAMPFPARYQRVNERARVLRMLAAFLEWQGTTSREVLGLETSFALTVSGPEGPIRVAGKVDRLDRSADGSVRVVDYKTSRTAIAIAAAAEHPQLGIYQAAVEAGAFDTVDPNPGGGELVFLADVDRHGQPKLRTQPPLDTATDDWVGPLIVEAAGASRGPGFPARRGRRCGSCPFHALCPAQARGLGARA